ncbi:hypothetical protein JCM5296_000718, partial [Sporobolomyces johnsonii]
MASTAAPAAQNGQEGLSAPPQPSAAAPASSEATTTAPATDPTTKAVLSAWDRSSPADRARVLQFFEGYLQAAGFEEGKAAGAKLRAIYSDPATTYSTALLSSAARALQSPERTVPPNTIRHTILTPSATSVGAPRHLHLAAVCDALHAHYDGDAPLPAFEDLELPEDSPYKPYIGGVMGTRVHAVNAGRNGAPPSYEVDVAFRSSADFEAALARPFSHHGRVAPSDYALPAALSGVVELRLELKHIQTPDAAIVKAFTDSVRILPHAKVLKVLKHFDTTRSGPAVPTFHGRVSAYVRFEHLLQDETGAYRQRLAQLLPSSVQIGGSTLPVRHNFEASFCPRCRFAGHEAITCPRFPCSACNKPGHTAATCTDPTGRPRRRTAVPATPRKATVEWQQVAPRTPKRPLQARSSGANLTPLGGRNPFALLSDESEGSETETEVDDRFPPLTRSEATPTRADRRALKAARRATSSVASSDAPAGKKARVASLQASITLSQSLLGNTAAVTSSGDTPSTTTTTNAPSSLAQPATPSTLPASSRLMGSESERQGEKALTQELGSADGGRGIEHPSPSASPATQKHHLDPDTVTDLAAVLPGTIYTTDHLLTILTPPLAHSLATAPVAARSIDGRSCALYLQPRDSPALCITHLYAPANHQDRLAFFSTHTPAHAPHAISILAGDLNDCPDPAVDRRNQLTAPHHWPRLAERFVVQLTDAVRHRHPTRALFTRPHKYNGRIVSWSRIDHLLISTRHLRLLRDAHIRYDAPFSDHRPVVATLALPPAAGDTASLPSTSAILSRINPSLFSDPAFAAAFATHYASSIRPAVAHLPPHARWERAKTHITSFASSYARTQERARRDRRLLAERTLAHLETCEHLDEAQQAEWEAARCVLLDATLTRRRTLSLRAHLPVIDGVPAELAALQARLSARTSASTFPSLRLADGSLTTDLDLALAHTDDHFRNIYTPSPRPPDAVASIRAAFLAPLTSSSPTSDPRFARRWDPALASALDAPFSTDEVHAAIAAAPRSSAPGPSGLPYEFFHQNSAAVVADLTAAFNSTWDHGLLPRSQAEARVRLLFKASKPGADPSALNSYRPIALREADYRLLARVLVRRLAPLLQASIPPQQTGFVPGRSSADAGRHLQLLVEELSAAGLPASALLSLDQEKAYDLVDHDWVLAVYAAFGAPPRFLRLLRAIYDGERLRARYIVNGFLSPGVPLRTGLPQGDPLSCASWLLSFQPFLDSLVRRRIALSLPSPISALRPPIATYLAFADDTILAVPSLATALPLLHALAADWGLATNGRLNPSKTEATAIGPLAREGPEAAQVRWTEDGFTVWAGFPISPSASPDAFYSLLLARLDRHAHRAASSYASPRTRALYANSHLLSPSLHLLAFAPAPPTFLNALSSLLANFVWGFAPSHPVARHTLFLPRHHGGLGLLNPHDFDTANSLRFLDHFLANSPVLWIDLAHSSFRRHVSPSASRPHHFSPWSIFRRSPHRIKNKTWLSIATTARKHPPLIDISLLDTSTILTLPPSLFSDNPRLSLVNTIASLHSHATTSLLYTLPPPSSSRLSDRSPPRLLWSRTVLSSPQLNSLLLVSSPTHLLPPPLPPPPRAFSFLSLPHPFSAGDARRRLALLPPPSPFHPSLSDLLPASLPPHTAAHAWRFYHLPPSTPREADTHWRVLHGA